MQYEWVIGEGHVYWNIKGWGHFVVFFWLNYFYFLRFAWYHLEQKVVPLRHQS